MPKIKDKTGQVFDRLTVLGLSPWTGGPASRWVCLCSCGNKRSYVGHALGTNTFSCGCKNADRMRNQPPSRKHGMAPSIEYTAWIRMKERTKEFPVCKADKANYWDRGIRVCEAWQNDFMAFYNHIGPKPSPELSLDRIDNDRGYEPGNVRWATRSQQMKNRRPSAYKRK